MFITKFGSFDGNSWEDLMQICFRLKYENEQYQSIPASSGDCGIEGYTKSGKVFQCYCPDNNMSAKELYEKQRDKITKDIAKLEQYEAKLSKFLCGVLIKEWIFVTPAYLMNDLLLHCNSKKQDLKSKNLSIIDPSFEIIVHDIDHFLREIPIALNGDQKLHIAPENQGVKITEWKDEEIDLVANAIRKHGKRFVNNDKDVSTQVNKLTDATIKSFLDRETILQKWRQIHPEDFDKYLILLGQIEKEVEEKCMFPSTDNNELYRSIRVIVQKRLSENFSYLDEITITNLTHGAIADWLLRCPLDFE